MKPFPRENRVKNLATAADSLNLNPSRGRLAILIPIPWEIPQFPAGEGNHAGLNNELFSSFDLGLPMACDVVAKKQVPS